MAAAAQFTGSTTGALLNLGIPKLGSGLRNALDMDWTYTGDNLSISVKHTLSFSVH